MPLYPAKADCLVVLEDSTTLPEVRPDDFKVVQRSVQLSMDTGDRYAVYIFPDHSHEDVGALSSLPGAMYAVFVAADFTVKLLKRPTTTDLKAEFIEDVIKFVKKIRTPSPVYYRYETYNGVLIKQEGERTVVGISHKPVPIQLKNLEHMPIGNDNGYVGGVPDGWKMTRANEISGLVNYSWQDCAPVFSFKYNEQDYKVQLSSENKKELLRLLSSLGPSHLFYPTPSITKLSTKLKQSKTARVGFRWSSVFE